MSSPQPVAEYLAKLVSFPTVSSASNLDLVQFIEAEMVRLAPECAAFQMKQEARPIFWCRSVQMNQAALYGAATPMSFQRKDKLGRAILGPSGTAMVASSGGEQQT